MSPHEHLIETVQNAGADVCVDWRGGRITGGYGTLRLAGKQTYAHRLACTLAHGEPAPKMDAAHSCGRRACINPHHLRWATRSENQLDRALHGTSLRGEQNHNSRLSTNDVHDVRQRLAIGEQQKSIAARYDVDPSTISHIAAGNSWGWLK